MPTLDLNRHENLMPVAAFMLGQIDFGRNRLIASFKELTPEQLATTPAGFGNSIATLVLHIATTEVGFAHALLGKPVPEALAAEFPKHMPATPLPAMAAGATAQDLTAKLEKSRAILAEALSTLTLADLTREIPLGPDRSATVQWLIGILPGHQSQHYGHIQMIAKHL